MAGFIMGLLPASATATQSVFIVYVALHKTVVVWYFHTEWYDIHILWNYSKLVEHFLSYVFNTTDLQIDYSFQLTDSIEV